jgi:XRE family aerobic/anaerobic benzoate catabolism transcriptional regulator
MKYTACMMERRAGRKEKAAVKRLGSGGSLLEVVGGRIRAARQASSMTLRDLAKASSVSERFLVSLEAGKTNVSILRLEEIATALGTSLVELVGGESTVNRMPSKGPIIALLGLRGAGKTTLGGLAASRLGMSFVEVDGDEFVGDLRDAGGCIFSTAGT